MKLIHLSDLHIGKRINGFSMIEDQNYILDQILEVVRQENPRGVILAGDIYDKPVPSGEAVQLFDRFLTELADTGTAVFAISGNHDSPERTAFGSSLMAGRQIYLSPVYDGRGTSVRLQDEWGEAVIHLIPFIKPALARHVFQKEISTYTEALKEVLDHLPVCQKERNVLVAHQFVTGASLCDSEELIVGGIDQVPVSLFDEFDYVALGHIHSPQYVGRETVRYCGTPLKYSFSEASQTKTITVVELKEKGNVSIREIPLKPLRDMRKIRGTYQEVAALDFYRGTDTGDYLQVTLTDEKDIPDGLQKLRAIYPNLMQLEYDNARTRENRTVEGAVQIRQKSPLELVGEFYEIQNNTSMSREQRSFVEKTVRELGEREKDTESEG